MVHITFSGTSNIPAHTIEKALREAGDITVRDFDSETKEDKGVVYFEVDAEALFSGVLSREFRALEVRFEEGIIEGTFRVGTL